MGHVDIHMDQVQAMFADPTGPVAVLMEEKAQEVKAVARGLLLLPGSGHLYLPGVLVFKRGSKIYSNWSEGGDMWPHVASSAGQPPAYDTGELYASLEAGTYVEGTVRGWCGSSVPYILYLELGTRYMAPRPFLVPALHIATGA